MVISDSFHRELNYSIKVFTPFLDTFKWTSAASAGQNILNCSNPQFLERHQVGRILISVVVAKAKVADRILVLQTKDHLFDCPAQFHSPQTKTVIKQYWEQMLDFSTTIEFKSHSHFDLYSNQVLETQKRCRSPDARARVFLNYLRTKNVCTFDLVGSTVNLIRHF